jgi:gamma-glutamyltranspeptidase/glutathione hydrolase
MSGAARGVVAAGHPLTAAAGAQVLRDGGNAVDAAVGAMLTSFVAEPLLTGLGAGGYMLVAGGGIEPSLLDFFVAAPNPPKEGSAELQAIAVSFGDAEQIFYIGPASCGIYGTPAGVCEAARRWGTVPLAALAEPAARLARDGVVLNGSQAYVAAILTDLLRSTPESAALWAPRGSVLGEGDTIRNPELADALTRLGGEGAAPFYSGDIAAAVCDWLAARGGLISAEALAGYEALQRAPLSLRYRDRRVLTNPPPSAGGILIAHALAHLDGVAAPPTVEDVLQAMEGAQRERTPDFIESLHQDGFDRRFLASPRGGGALGSTTHISVLDRWGCACSVTTTNGEGSAVVVPGTGIHLNNVMGEEDLSPLGFHRHPAGARLPSMMAPTVVLGGDDVELVLGSAGSNRIRSAILQTIVAAVDHDMSATAAVNAPRMHFESGVVYHEPGVSIPPRPGREIVGFGELNLFFGGVQAVECRNGRLEGAGDPRRGGVAATA